MRNLAVLAAASCAAWLIWTELRGRGWLPGMAPPKDRAVTRIQTVEALVRQGREGAAELAAALSDADPKIRQAALHGLGRLGPLAASHLDLVRDRLSDDAAGVRYGAVIALRQISGDAATTARTIAPLLADADDDVREAAGKVLERTGPAAVEPVIGVIENHRGPPRQRGIMVLRRLQRDPSDKEANARANEEITKEFRRLAESDDESVRNDALIALIQRGAAEIGQLRLALHQEFSVARAFFGSTAELTNCVDVAIAGITRLGPDAAELVPDLIEVLNRLGPQNRSNASPGTRAAAILKALSAMKSAAQPAIPSLLRYVEEEPSQSRIQFAQTLFDIGADRQQIADILTPLLARGELLDIWNAGKLLVTVSPDEARRQVGPAISRLQAADGSVDKPALFALYGLAPEAQEALPSIKTLISDSDRQVSSIAINILGQLGPSSADALPDLLSALKSKPATSQPEVFRQVEIVQLIGKLGRAAAAAVPNLVALFDALDSGAPLSGGTAPSPAAPRFEIQMLREAIIGALGRIGERSESVLERLRSTVHDSSEGVRALVAIAADESSALREALSFLADDSDDVRGHAALAISEISGDRTEAVAPLMRDLDNENPYVRTAAAIALGKIGPAAKRSLPVLRELLADATNSRPNSHYWSRYARPTTLRQIPELRDTSVEQAARDAIAAITAAADDK